MPDAADRPASGGRCGETEALGLQGLVDDLQSLGDGLRAIDVDEVDRPVRGAVQGQLMGRAPAVVRGERRGAVVVGRGGRHQGGRARGEPVSHRRVRQAEPQQRTRAAAQALGGGDAPVGRGDPGGELPSGRGGGVVGQCAEADRIRGQGGSADLSAPVRIGQGAGERERGGVLDSRDRGGGSGGGGGGGGRRARSGRCCQRGALERDQGGRGQGDTDQCRAQRCGSTQGDLSCRELEHCGGVEATTGIRRVVEGAIASVYASRARPGVHDKTAWVRSGHRRCVTGGSKGWRLARTRDPGK